MIQRLVNDGPLSFLEVEPSPQDESCFESKITKRPFGSKCNKARGLLEPMLGDVFFGFVYIKARSEYK